MPDRGSQVSAFGVTRVLLGLILLLAAGLKAHQLATEPVPGDSLLTTRWFLIVWVEVEVLLGLWLVSGYRARASWGMALLCFAVFTVVTLVKAIRGDASCGCFGRVEVSPWYTLVLDLAAVVALAVFRPAARTQPLRRPYARWRLAATAAAALVAGVAVALVTGLYEPARLAEDGEILGPKRVVLLEPETWVGRPCPILKHVDIGKSLGKGRWTVVLYHHDCPHCEERVPEFEREARQRAGRLAGSKVAMVELAPYAPKGKSLLPPDTNCTTGRVSDARDWFVETPTVLVLVEGAVVDAKEGDGRGQANRARLAGLTPAPGETPVAFQEGGYDFGFVKPKAVHKVLLEVPNPTGRALTVTRLRSECACMSAVAAEEPVPAGRSVLVRVVLVAPKKSQPYNKRILLQTDDPKHPLIAIPIKAAVGLPLSTDPPRLDFGAMAGGEREERTVTISNRLDKPVRLIYSTSSGSGCFARVPREPVPALGNLTVPVVVTARGKGRGSVTVRIQTDLDLQPAVNVPVTFTVRAPGESAGPLRAGAGPGMGEVSLR